MKLISYFGIGRNTFRLGLAIAAAWLALYIAVLEPGVESHREVYDRVDQELSGEAELEARRQKANLVEDGLPPWIANDLVEPGPKGLALAQHRRQGKPVTVQTYRFVTLRNLIAVELALLALWLTCGAIGKRSE